MIRLTHSDYPTYSLTRNDSADWTIEVTEFESELEIPQNVSVNSLSGNNSNAGYVVTQVDRFGNESLPSDYDFAQVDDQLGAYVTWTPIDDAAYYRIYRTRTVIAASAIMNRGFQTGYIGQSKGAHFTDANLITPDFTQTPPQGSNPFSNGRILSINIDTAGTGYTNASVISGD